jgi:glycosyltransferase involved in cell wall biosynthesis
VIPSAKLYLIIGKKVNLKLDDNSVINCGFVERPTEILAACNVFLAPIISGTGIKVKIIEAFRYGIPVVSTNLGFRNFDNLNSNCVAIADKDNFITQAINIAKNKLYLEKISSYEKKYYYEQFSCHNITLYDNQYLN